MSSSSCIDGLVIKKRVLLNEDVLVTLFSQQQGKITLIAKGARSFRSRRAAHLQTGNLLRATIRPYHQHYYLEFTDLISAFSRVRQSQKMETVYRYFFILDRLLALHEPEEEVYRRSVRFLSALSSIETHPDRLFTSALWELLQLLGYLHDEQTLGEMLLLVEGLIEEKIPTHGIM